MNPELKELIALLQYRNSVGEPLQNIVMTRDLFVMIVEKAIFSKSMWVDESSTEIMCKEGLPKHA